MSAATGSDLPNLPDPGDGWYWEIEADYDGDLTLCLGQIKENVYTKEYNIELCLRVMTPAHFESAAYKLLDKKKTLHFAGTYVYEDGKLVKK